MNIGKILKAAGSVALDIFAPGARGVINEFLPDDKKLGPAATGTEADSVVQSLPPAERASLLAREIDRKIAQEEGWTSRYQAMVAADGQSTRPKIALMMAKVLAFEIIAFTVWAFWFPEQMDNPVLWTVFGTLTGVPASLLAKYFGELRKEQRNRQESLGAPPAASMASRIFGAFKQ